MTSKAWGGQAVMDAIAWCKANLGYTCWLCGHEIPDWDYTVDHVIERKRRPDLMWVKSNWRPAHGRKHRDLGCPGNYGRSGRRARPQPVALPGW